MVFAAWRARARAGARVLRRARDLVPLTNLGLALGAAAALAYFGFARVRFDYVLELASLLAAALLLTALLGVATGALLVRRAYARRQLDDATRALCFEARRGFLPLLRMPALRGLPLVEFGWTWEEPAGFGVELVEVDGELEEVVEHTTRDSVRRVVRRFVVEDGFGLARVVLRREEERPIRVLPWTGELSHAPLYRALAAGDDLPNPLGALDGDRVDMRRYVAGDPLRLVLWKVFARSRQLMVRTPERAVVPEIRVAAYLVTGSGDEAAAAAALAAVDGGLLGPDWTFAADGAEQIARDPSMAADLIAASRRARDGGEGEGAGLLRFAERAVAEGPVRFVLFVPPRPGPWVERAVALVRRHGVGVSVVTALDGFAPDLVARERWTRLLRLPDRADPEAQVEVTSEELAAVSGALARAGAAAVSAFARPTGRAVPLAGRMDRPAPLERRAG